MNKITKSTAAKVKVSSTDHIGLLAHDVFNVSIPKHHIPSSEYVFQHGPAENDPLYGAGAATVEADTIWGVDEDADMPILPVEDSAGWGATSGGKEDEDVDVDAALGTWVHVEGDEKLGGESGNVEFTVVG